MNNLDQEALEKNFNLMRIFCSVLSILILIWFSFQYWSLGGLWNKVAVITWVLISLVILVFLIIGAPCISTEHFSQGNLHEEIMRIRHPAFLLIPSSWFILLIVTVLIYPNSLLKSWWLFLIAGIVIFILIADGRILTSTYNRTYNY